MELGIYFRSIVDQDTSAVVVCDTDHNIIYMNPSAVKRYEKRGGASLIGKSLLDCHNAESREKIKAVVKWFSESKDRNRVYTFYNGKENKDVYMIALRDENEKLIGYYEKHEYRTRETAKLYDLSD